MHSRTLLPALLLLATGCAQVQTPQTLQQDASVAPRTKHNAFDPALAANAHVADATTSANASARALSRPQPAAKAADAEPELQVAAPPPAPRNLWERINDGYALPAMDNNDLVRDWENWYANRPDYVARMIDRSRRFLFHIVEEVEKRGMPMEVALLPMIESAYNPVAYSRAHASGIWQFIPSTGKDYGLRQNWWYDGRRDVIAATDAALDYLQKNYAMFGDWQLALAAYNWGEGAVARAIEKNRVRGLPTDYESLTMPAETRGYVPKLIAVKNIITNPARYGLTLANVPNEPYFDTVLVRQHIDLKVAAKLADIPVEEFKFLNPGHNKPVIKAGEAERILLPRHKVVTFLTNFERHDKPLVSWRAVTFRAGDKAEKVAAQHGMTLAELKQVNGLAAQRKLVAGQPLLVPVEGGVDNPELPDLPSTPVPLQKALANAKHAAHSRKYVQTERGARIVVQKATHHARAGQKVHQRAAQQMRADGGKRVKVAQAKSAAAPAKKQPAARSGKERVKLASR